MYCDLSHSTQWRSCGYVREAEHRMTATFAARALNTFYLNVRERPMDLALATLMFGAVLVMFSKEVLNG